MSIHSLWGKVWRTLAISVSASVPMVVTGCSSSSPVATAPGCSLNSDCNSPLVCVFSRCHTACVVSSDCPTGERCVSTGTAGADAGAASVCQLPIESTCTATSSCQVPTEVCGSDLQCRMPCVTSQDCPGGAQVCLSSGAISACYSTANPVDTSELTEAGLLGADGGMALDGRADSNAPSDVGADGDAASDSTTGTSSDAMGDASIDSTTQTGSDAAGDSTTQTASDAAGDSTTQTGSDAAGDVTGPNCGDAAVLPDGACSYCPVGACAHGTCVSGNQDYTCECYSGYTGTGTKTCVVVDSCLANNECTPEYPCQATASPGQACLGQFAAWPVSDPGAVGTGSTVLPSYATDPDAGTVTDQVTNLVWQLQPPSGGCARAPADAGPDAAAPAECTMAEATAYCSDLNLGGFTDWRIPTKIELESILDCSHAQPPSIANAFLPASASEFWTASTFEDSPSYNWTVRFQDCRDSYEGLSISFGIRCVRGTGIGPTTAPVHYTIHSAAIDAGTGDGSVTEDSVTDNWTGLTWERGSPGGSGLTPADAQAYCAGLGGGFRVPLFKELLTLVDPILYSPAIDTSAFPNSPNGIFWSSTGVVPANGNYYYVQFDYGDNYSYGTLSSSNTGYVRCVH